MGVPETMRAVVVSEAGGPEVLHPSRWPSLP